MRVVSLLPSATEILSALGGTDLLVGVSHSCDYPASVDALPRVTACAVDPGAPSAQIDAAVREISASGRALYSVDEARVRALSPDVILTQGLCDVCAVTEDDVRAIAARLPKAPVVVTLSATTLDAILADIATVGAATGLADEADELVTGLRARMRRVHDALKGARAPRPRVAVVEWTDPPFAGGHWVPELVRRAGGEDVLATPGDHSRRVTASEVVAANPDVVLVAPCGFDLPRAAAGAVEFLRGPARELRTREAWALDANSLTSRPGPRVVDGIEVMARIFNPLLFSPLSGVRARRVG